jgi:HD superfamily phosphodiesterase
MAPWARHLARELLQESLPRRWTHVQGVAVRARSLAPVLGADADLIEAAAWLHDIGYAPGLATTGLHQLYSARYLRDAQYADAMLCRLVAHHSDDPRSGRAGPSQSRPDHIALRIGGRSMPSVA